MLTLPTAMATLKDRQATGACFILKLVNGVAQAFYLSTKSINLTADGIQVKGIVQEFGGITQAINLADHSYNVNNVTVRLAAGWDHREAGGNWARITETIMGCWGRQAQILIYPGSYATALVDCLTIFDGKVTRLAYDGGSLVIEMDERQPMAHRILPQRLATRAIFINLPDDQIGARMPLAYGIPSEGSLYFRQTGFFPAMQIVESMYSYKYLVADHPCYSPGGDAWLSLPAVDAWGRAATGVTVNVNDSGRTTMTLDPATLSFTAILHPTGGYPGSATIDPANPVGATAAFDYDDSTTASVIAESTTEANIIFEWTQNGDSSNDRMNNTVAWLDNVGPYTFGIRYHRTTAVTPTVQKAQYWNGSAWVDIGTLTSSNMASAQFPWDYSNSVTGVLWHLNTGPTGGDGLPFRIRFHFEGTGWTANATVVAYIHEVQIYLNCRWPTHTAGPTRKASRRGSYNPAEIGKPRRKDVFGYIIPDGYSLTQTTMNVGMDGIYGGRLFGSWIDEGGRSNAYNAGQAITTAAAIIESLLRDELGLTSAQIDGASFDTIYNTYSSNAILSLTDANAIDSEEILRTLCWEHGYFLLRTPAGKVKLINYLGTGVGGTLYPWHLDELPKIEEVGVTPLYKSATINHTRLPHDGQYQRSFSVTDGNPTVLNTDISAIIDLETIRSTSSTPSPTLRIVTRLFGTERLMSQPHLLITLKTTGFRWIAIEPGDIFSLDATSFDPQIKCMGGSWASKTFMVYRKEVTETGVEFGCIYWIPPSL